MAKRKKAVVALGEMLLKDPRNKELDSIIKMITELEKENAK